MTGPRDWDKEMAEIDRLMASDKAPPPAAPAAGGPVARRDAGTAPPPARSAGGGGGGGIATRKEAAGVWAIALLGATGAASLLAWPYDRSCGGWLYAYLVGAGAIALAGLWAMRAAWRHRRGRAHIVGLLTLLAALGYLAAEILPRTGYAKVSRTWICTPTL